MKSISRKVNVRAIFTGNASFDDLPPMHNTKLNIVQCQRSSTYIADMIKDKYGIPYIRVSLFGLGQTAKALRDTAKFFGPELEERSEKIIKREMEKYQPQIDYYRSRLQGKTVLLYQGAPRAWHWILPLRDLGMEVVVTATTFGHKDDYEKIIDKVRNGTIVIDNP
ncbi:MAG TPA: hypothetical protein EYP22_06420 [Methanosarcinales archaeon]|nr:hypothetical protein [Methanosarcinales archaeon]